MKLLPGELKPSFKRDFKVHNRQERVDPILLLHEVFDKVVLPRFAFVAPLRSQSNQKDVVLCLELVYLHLLVDLHSSIFTSHAPVKQLIEVNVTVVSFDRHLQKRFLQLTLASSLLRESQSCAQLSKGPEEFHKLLLFDLLARILVQGQLFPNLLESTQICLEFRQNVFIL